MNEESAQNNLKPKGRRRWLWIVGGLAVFVVLAYLIATSSFFLKAIVLPKASQALNAKVTADSISASPILGSLTLRGASVQPEGGEALLQIREAHARFSLFGILRGDYRIPELTLTEPVFQIVQEQDGRSNLDPLLKAVSGQAGAGQPSAAKGPMQISLSQLAIRQGTIRQVKKYANGADQAEISGLNLTVDRIQNGQAGKVDIVAALKYELRGGTNAASPSLLEGKISGAYQFALGQDLVPQSVNGALKFEVARAQGAWADASGLTGTLDCALTPKNVEKLNLRFERAGASLGQLLVNGPFDPTRNEGRLKIEALALNRQVLNMFGAAKGLDFAQTSINGTNILDLSQKGNIISLNGRWQGAQAGLRRGQLATPPVDLDLDYQISIDLPGKSVVFHRLSLAGRQGARELLAASLDRAMNLSWGGTQAGFKEASINLMVTNLNLGDWSSLTGVLPLRGIVDFSSRITAQQDGQILLAQADARVRDFVLQTGTNRVAFAQIKAQVKARAEGYNKWVLEDYTLEGGDSATAAFLAKGGGEYALDSASLRLRVSAEGNMPLLLAKYPVPSVNCSTGVVKANFLYANTPKESLQSLTANIMVTQFSGECAGYQLRKYDATIDCAGDLKEDIARVQRFKLSANESFHSGGSCDVSGEYDLKKKSARFNFNIVDLNNYALGPFLSAFTQPLKLDAFSLTSSGSGACDLAGNASLTGDFKLANLVLNDPAKRFPASPLNLQMQLDAGLTGSNQVRLSRLVLSLGNEQPYGKGGAVSLSGAADLKAGSVQMTYGITNLNQLGLAPWVDPMIAPKRLASVNLDGSGALTLGTGGDASLKAALNITNLVMVEPGVTNSPQPLQAQLSLDGAMRARILEIQPCLLTLKPTERANNQVRATGRVDMTKTNAYTGQVALQSEALDLAPWQNMLLSTNAPAPAASGKKPASITAAQPQAASPPISEPAAISTPLQKFGIDVKIGRLYLGDVFITNLLATATVNGGEIAVKPLELSLNGGAVKGQALLNLGVPGYTYDVALQASRVPIEPLANTFAPAYRGQYQGDIYLDSQIKGAGITDPSLQKNLNGRVSFSLTNANVNLVSPFAKAVLTPVVVLLRLPELLESPLNAVSLQGRIGQGKVEIQPFTAYTPAFRAISQGTIDLAPVLTNSILNLPVDLALQRALAQKANLLPANTPTNTDFALLPNFIKVKGTLGTPVYDIQKFEIAKMGLRSISGLPSFIGGNTANTLTGIADLIDGKSTTASQTLTSNTVPKSVLDTNQAPNKVLNLLNNFLTPKPADTTTAKPANASNPPLSGLTGASSAPATNLSAPANRAHPGTNTATNLLNRALMKVLSPASAPTSTLPATATAPSGKSNPPVTTNAPVKK